MANNINFVDITKGFRRLGNFPTFSDEIFTSYAEASEYARNGAFGDSNAFCGQLVRVLPENADATPTAYIIDKQYKLVSVTEDIAIETKLSIPFSYNASVNAATSSIVVPAGFVLNTISVLFTEGFQNDDAIIIAAKKFNADPNQEGNVQILVISGSEGSENLEEYDTSNIIISDEDGSEFAIQSMITFTEKTEITVYVKTIPHANKGSGIVKIN